MIVWHLLNDPDARYVDLGSDDHANRLDPDRKTRDLVRQLQALGHTSPSLPQPDPTARARKPRPCGQAVARTTRLSFRSAEEDIKFAQAALLRLEALPQPGERSFDLVLERALWNSAHVALARPFMSGKGFLQPGRRTSLDDIRATLSAEHEATLTEALDARNRHVAHSVNARESVVVHADFWPPELGGSFHGVGLVHITNNSERARVPAY